MAKLPRDDGGWLQLGRRLAELRSTAGYTQHAFAPLTFYGRSTIANVEVGRQRVDRSFWVRCDEILGTGGELAAAHDGLLSARQAAVVKAEPVAERPAHDELGQLDEIARRVQWMSSSNVDGSLLDEMNRMVAVIGQRYETGTAVDVYPFTVRQRRWVDELLQGRQRPHERIGLYAVAGRLSALLGYLAFDLGRPAVARAYCDEAFTLALHIHDLELAAWIRGTQSFIAYYGGQYTSALELARDGQRFARGGPQSIRLAVNGEARALGRIGDAGGVDAAVDRALEARGGLPESDAADCFLSFEPYSPARLAGNAATAYLSLGDGARTRRCAELALAGYPVDASPACRTLTTLDIGASYLQGSGPDPEQASAVVAAALKAGGGLASAIIANRAQEFVASASRWRALPAVAALTDEIDELRRREP